MTQVWRVTLASASDLSRPPMGPDSEKVVDLLFPQHSMARPQGAVRPEAPRVPCSCSQMHSVSLGNLPGDSSETAQADPTLESPPV